MRISKEQMCMQLAEVMSRRATCYRRSVGAIIIAGKDILSWGYNGPASGEPHCTGASCGGEQGCQRAIHAEANAIDHIPRAHRKREKALFVTESPCVSCALRVVADGTIKHVYYQHEYRIREGIDTLLRNGIEVYRMTPAGYIVRERDGQVVQEA